MAKSKPTNNENNTSEKEYELAISLMQYYTELLWKEFNAFLLTETVLIGFLGTILAQEHKIPEKNWLVFGGAIFGLVLCIPWLSTFLHNYEYYVLRIAQAKRHETTLGIKLMSEGGKLSSGLCIDEKVFRHPWLARTLPPRRAISFLIFIFVTAFAILMIISGPW